jgi:hypothetical protein
MYIQNKYSKWYNSIITQAKSRTLPPFTYTEKHHIHPKSLGGDNSKENLVMLTAREHFICHLLLPKMVIGTDRRNMSFAIWSMLNRDHSTARSRYKVTSHIYEILKKQVAAASSALHKGKTVSDETRKKISDARKGKPTGRKGIPMSDEQKLKLSIAKKGTYQSPETIAKQAASRTGQKRTKETKAKMSTNHARAMLGKQHTEETKAKMSIANKGRLNANKGKPAFNRGVPMSDIAKQNMREGHKNREMILCPHCNRYIAKCSYSRFHGDKCKHHLVPLVTGSHSTFSIV